MVLGEDMDYKQPCLGLKEEFQVKVHPGIIMDQ
jgi:hypothetical protein